MPGHAHSTLWPVSEYERVSAQGGASAFSPLGQGTTLSSSLIGELRQTARTASSEPDLLEGLAACMRLRERALLLLAHGRRVWPLTLFPDRQMVHLARDLSAEPVDSLGDLRLLAIEPPTLRPPGDWRHESVTEASHYRPIAPLLWRLALHGPRGDLLRSIDARARFRVTARQTDMPDLPGACGPALRAMRERALSLTAVARLPGMSAERAVRLLNGLYLNGQLMVLRSAAGQGRGLGWLPWRP